MSDRTQEPRRLGIDESIERPDETVLLRLEEEADARPGGWRGVGFLRAKKRVETISVDEPAEQETEELDVERTSVTANDPGGIITLPDGGVSIPIYEEELVVTKRVVLKERVVIRKRIETRSTSVRADLRREHIDIDVDPGLEDRITFREDAP